MLKTVLAALTIAASLSAQTYWDSRPVALCAPGKWGVESATSQWPGFPTRCWIEAPAFWQQQGGTTIVLGSLAYQRFPWPFPMGCDGFVDPAAGLFVIGIAAPGSRPIKLDVPPQFAASQRHQVWIYAQGFYLDNSGITPLDVWKVEWPVVTP